MELVYTYNLISKVHYNDAYLRKFSLKAKALIVKSESLNRS